MEFQFGTNWAYYSHYVGDIFGAPLAIEGLMAFFLESTFIGLFFFGWDRLSQAQHLVVTLLMAVGSNLSALWILIANGWMQNPVGAEFNSVTMRMEMTDFWAVLFNPVAQAKFVHTVSAGYVTGAMFVLAISAWYLLKGRDIEFAKRSFRVAAAFGLASALSRDRARRRVRLHRGRSPADQAGRASKPCGKPSRRRPASRSWRGINEAEQKNDWEIEIPWVMGLIGTRSISKEIPGIHEIKAKNRERIGSGIEAVTRSKPCARTRDDAARQAAVRAAQGRPRLRPAAEEIRGRCARRPRPR